METTTAIGIPNYDASTGIHYGVIPAHVLGDAWYESSTPNYTESCPECGHTDIADSEGDDASLRCCQSCGYTANGDMFYGDDPDSITYDDADYTMTQNSMGDVFVIRSPFYTYARECSPCAPNAGYITSQVWHNTYPGIKTYAPGPDWLEGSDAKVVLYSVETNIVVAYVNY